MLIEKYNNPLSHVLHKILSHHTKDALLKYRKITSCIKDKLCRNLKNFEKSEPNRKVIFPQRSFEIQQEFFRAFMSH